MDTARIRVLLNREGWKVGKKLVYRLYKEEGLTLRHKPRRKRRAALHRRERFRPTAPNEVWSLDFVADQLADGRRFWALTIEKSNMNYKIAIAAFLLATELLFCQSVSHSFNFRGAPVRFDETGKSGFTVENRTDRTVAAITFVCVGSNGKTTRIDSPTEAYRIKVDPRDTTSVLSTGQFWQRDSCVAKHARIAIGAVGFSDGTSWTERKAK